MPLYALAACAVAAVLTACAGHAPRGMTGSSTMFTTQRISEHRGNDDLLTGGLGLDGLRAIAPPAFADPEHPTAAELRRRALWANWRGIADLAPGGGYGTLYGSTVAVPGREFHAYARLPEVGHPHRVLLQLPDAFDARKRCIVVTASSGSRGIYGAIAVAGAWGLPKGCAVAYTDKGAGTDYFDLDAQVGVTAGGATAPRDRSLAFAPDAASGSGIAFKHAHSQDNPEADWGRHVRQTAEFALHSLNTALPDAAPFTFDNTRVIAVGISNGGGAALRAAELDGDWLDAVVAGEPNIHVEGRGSRALYDYTTEAALLMPCALLHMQNLPQPPVTAQSAPMWGQRCASLKTAGLVEGNDVAAQSKSAYDQLRANGWTDGALRAGALSVGFDLWRAVAVTYASAYGRYQAGAHPCGFGFGAQNPDASRRSATAAERNAWWSDASGIPPGAGVGIIDSKLAVTDATYEGLQCLRGLWNGQGADADRVRKGIAEITSSLPRRDLPIIVLHGTDDGLVPMAFNSTPYIAHAKAAGRDVRYWQVSNAQHFDAFLGLPDYAARYVPMLPYVYAALDRVEAYLDSGAAMPAEAVIETVPRGVGKPLTAANMAIPL
ncbi:MAG: D-(-)-3-hydroxybutyrate oligomer hydrolase [Pseudomonadota bacterium]|nr:D-(-)-3-hydroxybutyrate oligomer hydrolase [Pseudomonadota bacterium]